MVIEEASVTLDSQVVDFSSLTAMIPSFMQCRVPECLQTRSCCIGQSFSLATAPILQLQP